MFVLLCLRDSYEKLLCLTVKSQSQLKRYLTMFLCLYITSVIFTSIKIHKPKSVKLHRVKVLRRACLFMCLSKIYNQFICLTSDLKRFVNLNI